MIRELVADGATLLLTTQYLEEADELADRIIVVDHGTVIAAGTAAELEHPPPNPPDEETDREKPPARPSAADCRVHTIKRG